MLQDARIDCLIMDFARLDPTADGVLSAREFAAALAKHGVEPHRIDALVQRFKKRKPASHSSQGSDLPRSLDEIDYVAFLAHVEEAAEQKNNELVAETGNSNNNNIFSSPTLSSSSAPSLHPAFRHNYLEHEQQQQQKQTSSAMMPRNANTMSQHQHQQKGSFIDRALSNASRALLSHHQKQQLPEFLQATAPSASIDFVPSHVHLAANHQLRNYNQQQQQQQLQQQHSAVAARSLYFDAHYHQQNQFQQLVEQVATSSSPPSASPQRQQEQQRLDGQSPTPKKQLAAVAAADTSVALSPLTPGSRSFMLTTTVTGMSSSASAANSPVQQARQTHTQPAVNHRETTTSSSTNSSKVSLPFIFARIDADGDGKVSINDILQCTMPPCFGRLELEVLVETVLLSDSSSPHAASSSASSDAFDANGALLNISQFGILFSRMKSSSIAKLRNPETWKQPLSNHRELAAEQSNNNNTRLEIHRQARWNQKIQQQEASAIASTPPPASSRLQQQQQQQQQHSSLFQPSPVSFNPSPRHETPPRPTTATSTKTTVAAATMAKVGKDKAQQHRQAAAASGRVSSFMRATTSSALRTGRLSSDVDAVRKSLSAESTATTTAAPATKQSKSNSRCASSSSSSPASPINLRVNNAKSTATVARRGSKAEDVATARSASNSSENNHRKLPTASDAASAPPAASFPPAVAALLRGKASHIMTMCQIVDRHSTGFVPAARLLDILRTINSAAPESELVMSVAAAKQHHHNKQHLVDFSDFVRQLVASASSTTASSSPSPRPVSSPRQERGVAVGGGEDELAAVSPDSRKGSSSPASGAAAAAASGSYSSRSPSAPSMPAQADKSSRSGSRQEDAAETLRQMLRTELNRVTKNTPQLFIDCLLAASKASREHRTKDIWMVRVCELFEALSAVYGASYTAVTSPARHHSHNAISTGGVIYSAPPDWVMTRSRKIGQTPFQQMSTCNSVSCSPRAKQCRRRAHDWLLCNPRESPDDWVDAAFLLEALYLE